MGRIVLPNGTPFAVDGDTGKVSDGFHDFDELYEYRITLWIALCRLASKWQATGVFRFVWRSKLHSDGSAYPGWFVLGIGSADVPGSMMTYHLPESRWDDCAFAQTLDRAPEYDGHTSADVLERLKAL